MKWSTIRSVLSIVAAKNLHLEQLYIKIAFLHCDLDEEIYMYQPEGFVEKGKENLVCKFMKSLYGLKQAPRHCYQKFDGFRKETVYHRCNANPCCYFKSVDSIFFMMMIC